MDDCNELLKQLNSEQKILIKEIGESWPKKGNIQIAIKVYNLRESLPSLTKNKFSNFMKEMWRYSKKNLSRLCTIGEFCQLLEKNNIPLPISYAQIEPLIKCIPNGKEIGNIKKQRIFQMIDLWAKIAGKENLDILTKDKVIYYLTDWKENGDQYTPICSYRISDHKPGEIDNCDELQKQLNDEQKKLIKEINELRLKKRIIEMADKMYNLRKSLSSWNNCKFNILAQGIWKYSNRHLSRLLSIGEFCQILGNDVPHPVNFAQIEPILNCIPQGEKMRIERILEMINLWNKIIEKEDLDNLTRDKVIYYVTDWKKNSGLYIQLRPYRISDREPRKNKKRKRNEDVKV